MKKILLVAGLLASQSALAHVSYSGRDFGSFDGLSNQSVTIANQTTRSFSWADAADADWGDTHAGKWFTFTLTNDALVTISASAFANATATSVGGLLPGFSLYAGKAPAAAYDGTDVTLAYRNNLGFETEGAWNAAGDFLLGNEAGEYSTLKFLGYAVDGTSANYGNLAGITGDGNADGLVSGNFSLAAGSYTLIFGGADYTSQDTAAAALQFGLSTTLSVAAVPEPGTYDMLLLGLGLLAVAARRNPSQA